ncbi:phage baseplate protein [Enterococcus nangangensis]|uniref:phage baseplate protein n=1 Tax=Enterococcus nangangensis TaxID=2559926 RepID=UPI001484F854|nr:BppU family phage baseplate upper protein [Enterococcus nangangensis]
MTETLRFDLNKQKFGNPIIYGRVSDGNEYKKSVQFLMDGKPFDLTDWVVSFEGITAHFKNKIMDTVGVTLTDAPNGKFDYVFPNASFSQHGKYERAYFSAVKGDKRVTTADFVVIVLDYADIDAQKAEDFISEYNRLVVELNSRFNSAINQMDADYDDLDQRVTALQQAMITYEASVESTASEAIQAVNDALEQLGTYYTKTESNAKFLSKTDAESLYIPLNKLYLTYPIGSPYFSFLPDNPATVLGGGTWERVANGRTLVGVDENDTDFATAGLTGGEKMHVLTVSELAKHSHAASTTNGLYVYGGTSSTTGPASGTGYRTNLFETSTTSVGGDTAHNNLQPYITVYIWKRIA